MPKRLKVMPKSEFIFDWEALPTHQLFDWEAFAFSLGSALGSALNYAYICLLSGKLFPPIVLDELLK